MKQLVKHKIIKNVNSMAENIAHTDSVCEVIIKSKLGHGPVPGEIWSFNQTTEFQFVNPVKAFKQQRISLIFRGRNMKVLQERLIQVSVQGFSL